MRILHICTTLKGGAGKAVLRLHKALLEQGVESKILCKNKFMLKEHEIYYASPISRTILKKLLSRFGIYRNYYQKTKKYRYYLNNILSKCQIFSFPFSDYRLHKYDLVKKSDIINLHWVGNFLDYQTFFKNVRKPIVWTLHDKNPLMGGLHLENDFKNNFFLFDKIESILIKIKRKSVIKYEKLFIVSPSKSLGEYSKQSIIFNKLQHFIIPNGIDTKLFKLRDKKIYQDLFNIESEKKIILFAAGNISIRWKGFNILLKALEKLDFSVYHCIALGENSGNKNNNLNIQYLGHLNDERFLSCIYSAADVFVIPTLEDNLPNTVLESLACGTPIIGSNVGGVPDMVREGITGMLFEPGNSEELAKKIEEFFALSEEKRKEMSENCRRISVSEYDQNIQAEKYIELYKQIMTRN